MVLVPPGELTTTEPSASPAECGVDTAKVKLRVWPGVSFIDDLLTEPNRANFCVLTDQCTRPSAPRRAPWLNGLLSTIVHRPRWGLVTITEPVSARPCGRLVAASLPDGLISSS